MPQTVPLSFRVSPEKAKKIERLSKATDRPKSWLLEQALEAYLEAQAWQVEHIEASLDDLMAGKGVPHERVAGWLAGWGTDDEGEPPR